MKETTMPTAIQNLRHSGVVADPRYKGQAYRTYNLCSEPGIHIEARTALIAPDRYDYGYHIIIDAGKVQKAGVSAPVNKERHPGEFAGWFRSADDAELYLLHALRTIFAKGSPIIPMIDTRISKILSPSFF